MTESPAAVAIARCLMRFLNGAYGVVTGGSCHGSQSSVKDGSVISGPASRPLPDAAITASGASIELTARGRWRRRGLGEIFS